MFRSHCDGGVIATRSLAETARETSRFAALSLLGEGKRSEHQDARGALVVSAGKAGETTRVCKRGPSHALCPSRCDDGVLL